MRGLPVILCLAVLGAGVPGGAQREQLFPHTKKSGRATVEYRHDGFSVVANYDYSQRNHGARWLLIDIAAGSTTRFVIHRDNFTLVTPEGKTIPLATQQDLIADTPGVTTLIQNAKVQRQNIVGYFPQRSTLEVLSFYSIPGVRSVSNEAIVDSDRVTTGALLFKSPTEGWKEGTYRLAIDNAKAMAALPISLQ